MKLKRSITIPLVLLIYIAAIGIYAWPGRNPKIQVSQTEYWMILGVSVACAIALYFIYRKRDSIRDKNKK